MKYYPIYLDITDKRCIVIGGGDVAERKVERLLEFGASVVVVGKTLTRTLEGMKHDGRIEHINADYNINLIDGAFLVIGATDSDDTNSTISRNAKQKGILVNIVDDPDKCDFILPSLFTRGDLLISISTGGKSPALAKKIRQEMEKYYGPEFQILVTIMGSLREKLLLKGYSSDTNKRLFESVIDSDILQYIQNKDWEKVKKTVYDSTGVEIEVGD
ncbi:MAG: bifunctional precorrin-2 dehydrogenase/sirohydrochlorin ferrochelatase [Syntrophaceae bacterium]